MTRKARIWTGATLLLVIAINYAIIGLPLMRKSASLQDKYRDILIKQVKSGTIFKDSEGEYILEVFKREKSGIERKLLVLNLAGVSLAVLIASWTVFGLIAHKKR
jgi:hypothetical protein